MNNIIIRQAVLDDIEDIAKIEKICFNTLEAADYQDFKDRYDVFGEWFLVAILDNHIIGFINGASTNDKILKDELYHDASLHIPDGEYQSVFGLAVLPEYRCVGIGHLLLQSYIDISFKGQKKAVILTCKDHLIHFYQSCGFIHLGRSHSTHGQAMWNDMIRYL
ncbi:MAG: GNAT family N-acetyltransferase [Erysipelotrichaceae bacterium]|nr:GNAT family N-acetyltransferase [Erysipelotrichaceae bacterium]